MRKRFVVALCFVFLAAAIFAGFQIYRAESEVTNLQRQVWNMESEIRIAKAKCK